MQLAVFVSHLPFGSPGKVRLSAYRAGFRNTAIALHPTRGFREISLLITGIGFCDHSDEIGPTAKWDRRDDLLGMRVRETREPHGKG